MIALLVSAVISARQPGPIDASMANIAAVNCTMEFTGRLYYTSDDGVVTRLEKFISDLPLPGTPAYEVNVRWESDGSAEHHMIRLLNGRTQKPVYAGGPLVACEILQEGSIVAYQHLKPGTKILHLNPNAIELPLTVLGPFTWLNVNRFDIEIRRRYQDTPIERKMARRGAYRTEVETYKTSEGDVNSRAEIWYDPEVGYVPRFYRSIALVPEAGRIIASVRECYVCTTNHCTSGGFVPTEWYVRVFSIDDFARQYPEYREETHLVASGDMTLVHCRATKLESHIGPVTLAEANTANRVYAPGGAIALAKGSKALTINQLKAKVGKRLQRVNAPALATIDSNELHQFDRGSANNGRWPLMALIAFGVTTLVGRIVWRIRRGAVMVLAMIGIAFTGCEGQRIPRVAAMFEPRTLIYDAATHRISANVVLSNVGTEELRVFAVDAGCSCRQVDGRQLPATLRRGESLKLGVRLSETREYEAIRYTLKCSTNHGMLLAEAELLAVPNHLMTPDGVTLPGLYEDPERGNTEGRKFELMHREVYEAGKGRDGVALQFPRGLRWKKIGTKSGRVGKAPEYGYVDDKYEIEVADESMGLHKESIGLKRKDGTVVLEVPIVWERLPFQSCEPQRVILGERPVRSFLRCRDDRVELVRVVRSPVGVLAVVSSAREISMRLAEDAPAVIDDFVEVETTAPHGSRVRVHVVRYKG